MSPRLVITSRSHGQEREAGRQPEVGASLIVDVGTPSKARYYLVTARHVVEGADDGSVLFLRSWQSDAAPHEPRVHEYTRSAFGEMWYYSRDPSLDVAVAPLSWGELGEFTDKLAIGAVPLTQGYNRYLGAGAARVHEFEEVLFVGYPEGLWDPESGFPIVRRGVTATSLNSDYRGAPTFLLDGAVHPGCSGGPVIILEQQFIPMERPSLVQPLPPPPRMEDRFAFLGMITDVLVEPASREARLNLGVVLKARKLFDVIHEYERITAA